MNPFKRNQSSGPHAEQSPYPRPEIASIPLDPLSMPEAMDWIVGRAERREPLALLATVNMDFFALAEKNPDFADLLRHRTALNLVDGWPIAWLLRRQGVRRVGRAPGSELTPTLLKSPAVRSVGGVFLLGDMPDTLEALLERGQREGWRDNVRDCYSPAREEVDDPAASARIVERINRSGASILLVAFGAPRQEFWVERWAPQLAPSVAIGIGGSFKFVAWPARRAPRWVQRSGLEWLHRMSLEPGRLGPRYAKNFQVLYRLMRK